MLVLTIFSIVYTGQHYDSGAQYYNGSYHSKSGDITIPSYNIWYATAAVAIIASALAVGVAVGFNFLGSGMSDTSQKMIFDAIVFLGIWAVLSVANVRVLFATTVMSFVWTGMTVMYCIGMAIFVNSVSVAD